MKLLVIGATGGIGTELVTQALQRGHQVTALVRSPERMKASGPGLKVVKGNPLDARELQEQMAGQDAVFSALGSGSLKPKPMYAEFARSAIQASAATGVRRLISVSAAILFPDLGFFGRLIANTFLKNERLSLEAMEKVVKSSSLDWTLVRPPRLTNGPAKGDVRGETNRLPGRLSVARADVAAFMLHEAEHPEHVREVVGVS
jgi:putative NADH-flavin reductase